jgi:hypothetical protein
MFNPRWTLQKMVHPISRSKLPKKIIIMNFFLLVELKTKLVTFTTTHWNTITLKMKKIKQKKVSQNFEDLKWKLQICKIHFNI